MSNKYDSYKDSGIEWIGEIPSHWKLKPLKHLVFCNKNSLGENTNPEIEINYIEIGDVSNIEGIKETTTYSFEKAPSRARRIVKEGDVIISTVRTYLKAITSVESKYDGFIASTGFAVLSPKSINSGFLGKLVLNDGFIGEIISLSKGVSYPSITASDLINISIPFPKIEEQTAIANYLDKKTTQLDELIAKKERLIQLLEEERTAIINQAVTKGINPNVQMKDSGIEWLGEIPEHWDVKKLKYVSSLITLKAIDKPEYIVALENIESWTGEIIGKPFENQMEGDAQLFEKGDILFNKLRPYLAKVTLTNRSGGAMGELLVLRPKENVISEFLFHRLRSEMIITIVDGSTYGTKMPRASWDKFISLLEFGVPPIEEQIEIVNFIEFHESKLNKLKEKYQQEINLFNEYKTALISEVVTGKVDVRDFQF